MNRIRWDAWFIVLLAMAIMTGTLSGQVSGRPSAQEIDALRSQVRRLQQCWYVAQDEPCFWGLVTAVSHMRRPENRYETFHGAFTGTPNLATLKLGWDATSVQEIEKNAREAPNEARP